MSTILKGAFFQNVAVVMSGTAVAQVLGFALSPVVSRLYTPSDFGVFGSFQAVLGVIAAGATLDYSQAVMLPKKEEAAINLFVLSCLATALISACTAIVCASVPGLVGKVMRANDAWVLGLLVGAVLASGVNQSCQAWCVRSKAFRHTSVSQIVRSSASNGVQIGFGLIRAGSMGLIVGRVLGDLLASCSLLFVVLKDLKARLSAISWEEMKRLARDYRDFPTYSASQNVINSLSSRMPVLMLSHFYGIAMAGAYSFAMRVLEAPMGFVLTALRQVLFQRASEADHYGSRLLPLYLKVTAGLFFLAIVPSIAFLVLGPNIFAWVFGGEWLVAGRLSRSLVLWLVFAFCNLPAVLFAKIMRMQRFVFVYDLCLLGARAATLVVGGLSLDAESAILLFALVGAGMNSVLIARIGCAVAGRDKEVLLQRK